MLQCSQCGGSLPADISVAVCPKCELRGALDLSGVSSQVPSYNACDVEEVSRMVTPESRRFGNYELLEMIARGGMGIVYRARQVGLDRIVALKMLLAGPLAGADFIQRFRTEAAAAASLHHPNIVAIHEVGFIEGQHFFAMDFVAGLTLAQVVAKGPLSARNAAQYLQTIAETIQFAHERNVLHRDLKPSNVLIDSATDEPHITDFGLAKRLDAETDLTLSGQVLGSPNFMSPEQATARRGTVGKQSDIYSLGAVLYYSLTGRPPFQGETLADILHQVVHTDPLAPHLLAPRIPRDLETICLKCMQKEKSARYQTAQELADELSRFLRGEPIFARPVTTVEQAWRWCRRKPAIASLSAATLLLLLAVAIGSPIAVFRIKNERDTARHERDRADQNAYDSDMSSAGHAWEDGDLGGTRSLLEAHLPRGEPDRRGFEWYYFWNLCQGDQRSTFTNHSHTVSALAISADGKRLATGSVGSPVQVWDCVSEQLITSIPEQDVVSLSFGSEGNILGVGGRDRLVVWNLATGSGIFTNTEALARFHIAFLPSGNLLVIGKHAGPGLFDGGSAELWDYARGKRMQVFPDSGGKIALSPRSNRLATGDSDHATKIWDLSSGQLISTVKAGGAFARALSQDGQTLATADMDPEVKLWDITSGKLICGLANKLPTTWSLDFLAFSPNGRSLAIGGADQIIHLWDVATRQQTSELHGHGSEVVILAFSADGQTLASGSKDRKAMLWSEPFHGRARAATTVPNVSSHPIFSADGQLIAAGVETNHVAVWDSGTLQVRAVIPGAHDALAFSLDGHALTIRGTNYFLKIFDINTRTARKTISNGPAAQDNEYAALSPDGKILAVGSVTGTLTFSDANSGRVKTAVSDAYAGGIFPFNFSPNSKLLATCGMQTESEWGDGAKIWDASTGKLILVVPPDHSEGTLVAAFSPDGKTLATAGVDTSIRFWDTSTWTEILPSVGHKEYERLLAFSPDGKTLASTSADGVMKLWSAATRRQIASLGLPNREQPTFLQFSPDGQTLAGWNIWSGALQVWRAPMPKTKEFYSRND